MDNQTPTSPFVIPPTKKRTISFTYVTDAFFNSVQRFPVTLIYLAAFIIWGLIDIWTPYGFFRDSADPLIQNLEPALWFLTVNGMLLSLAVYLWCEQSAHKFLCLKCHITVSSSKKNSLDSMSPAIFLHDKQTQSIINDNETYPTC